MAVIKGVVVESRGREAVILTRDGEFRKIRVKAPVEVGEEIERRQWCREILLYSAAAVVLFLFSIQIASFFTVCAYASVEINPGIEMGFNRWERVVTTRGLDKEGENLLETLNLRGYKVDKAVELVIAQSTARGYITPDKGEVVMAVVPLNQTGEKVGQELVPRLQDRAVQVVEDKGISPEVVRAVKASPQDREQALEKSTGPGTYLLDKERRSDGGKQKGERGSGTKDNQSDSSMAKMKGWQRNDGAVKPPGKGLDKMEKGDGEDKTVPAHAPQASQAPGIQKKSGSPEAAPRQDKDKSDLKPTVPNKENLPPGQVKKQDIPGQVKKKKDSLQNKGSGKQVPVPESDQRGKETAPGQLKDKNQSGENPAGK